MNITLTDVVQKLHLKSEKKMNKKLNDLSSSYEELGKAEKETMIWLISIAVLLVHKGIVNKKEIEQIMNALKSKDIQQELIKIYKEEKERDEKEIKPKLHLCKICYTMKYVGRKTRTCLKCLDLQNNKVKKIK